MLNYVLKENCISPTSIKPIEDYLISLGIKLEDVDSFIKEPRDSDELSPWLLNNMQNAVYSTYKWIQEHKKFFLIVDCDVDGFTSSAIFYRYFKSRYADMDITYMLHEGKEHGIELDKIPEDCDVVIIPDAGSMQKAEQQELLNRGKSILILDHHEVSGEIIDAEQLVLVNNQVSDGFSNKSLSGAGVTFKFIQAYDESLPDLFVRASDYYDLAALGIIADAMDMRTLDNNYIAYHGLKSVKNKMFQALIKKQDFKLEGQITKYGVAFYIAPIINGVIRAGKMEEKELVFRGFIEEPTQEYFDHVYRGNSYHETYYEYAARTAANVKARQDTEKTKCFKFLCDRIEKEGLDKNRLIAVVASKDDKVAVPQTITGLIAMDLLKHYNKPVLVLRPKSDNGKISYAGSGRCKKFDGLDSFLQFVRDSEYSEYGEGHAMAFGAAIPAENFDKFIAESNERLANVDFGTDFIEVDAIFNKTNINTKMLLDFAKHKTIYGTNIPQPLIAIEATVSSSDILIMGSDKSSVRINIGTTPCIKFKDKELAEKVMSGSRFNVKLVGKPNLNTWNGTESAQLFIDSIEIEPVKTAALF